MANISTRTVYQEGREIVYQLERKPVKNLNLRIRKDASVYVSANPLVPADTVDSFITAKADYIWAAMKRFEELAQHKTQPKKYVSGETFYIQGRGLRLKVSGGTKDEISTDGVFLFLQVKNLEDIAKKKRIVTRYMDEQCKSVFAEIMAETYPLFQKYGVLVPTLRIRDMETRWGSCLAKKGIITLNKCLLSAPRNCIEYVVMHEFCHFIHPNHSKQYYSFLTMLMPDWRQRKESLDKCADYWL